MKAALAICVIVRDEAPYLAEWIEFHRLVGVERFFLYDDRSEDDTLAIVQRHSRGDITVHPYDEAWHSARYNSPQACTFNDTPQVCAYNHCVQNHAGDARWCAFIDVDEYLYHEDLDDLRVALGRYERHVGVFVPWLIFGRNGHATRPAGLTVEEYTRRGYPGEPLGYGNQGKQIARLDQLAFWGPFGSHNAVYHFGLPVDSFEDPVPRFHAPICRLNAFRLNHYYNRSLPEARAKAERCDRNAKPGFQPDMRRMDLHDLNHVEDRGILRFLPALQKVLGERCQVLE